MRTSEQLAAKRAQQRLLRQNRGATLGPAGHPFVPAKLILPLLEPLFAERRLGNIAEASRLGLRDLYDLRNGRRQHIRFDTADRLISVVLGRPELWWEIPELRAIYETR
jgi:hypothetical protein